MTNIAKYAGECTAQVIVTASSDVLRVEIADTGPGGATLSRGTGLLGLTDRLDVLGGALTIDSPAGCGTRLTATIPLLYQLAASAPA
jgi:signal transduction histidine kinase